MTPPPADLPALVPPAQGEGWSWKKIIFLIALAGLMHVALIFIFGSRKPVVPRAVDKVPHLQLANNADEIVALADPTLFARPNAHDFVTAFWQRLPVVKQPSFNWTEDPRFLPPAPEKFGAAFREFIQTNPPPETPLDFKPEPTFSAPVMVLDDTLPQATTMQISGELARRRRLNEIGLPPIPVNDVIAPSRVQVLVDTAGNVASAILLEPSLNNDADQQALQLARSLRFAPASRLMFGEIIFNWHTVPTNAP
jgi:TonB family protein